MTSQKSIRRQLDSRGLRPNKKLGQNFLVDQGYLHKIAALAAPDMPVLEIGAGLGALTLELARSDRPLVAVEIDRGLFTLLQDNLADAPQIRLIQDDILAMDLSTLFPAAPYQVIANIPYYLTSKLIRTLTEAAHPPALIHLLVQKEVAQRACADTPQMNLLALSIRLFGIAEKLFEVPAGSFYPAPKVDSAILRITPHADPPLDSPEALMRLARAAFQQKRKTLLNSLSSLPDWDKQKLAPQLAQAGIDPSARPQHLDLDQWLALAAALT